MDWNFGITMTLLGMGGTFLTLCVIILFIGILKRIFPMPESPGSGASQAKGGGR